MGNSTIDYKWQFSIAMLNYQRVTDQKHLQVIGSLAPAKTFGLIDFGLRKHGEFQGFQDNINEIRAFPINHRGFG